MNYDFKVLQGSDFKLTITLKDSAGAVRDITGKSFRGQARVKIAQDQPDIEFDFSDVDLANGKFQLEIPASKSTATKFRKPTGLVYDVEMFDGTETERVLMGTITLNPEVTR